MEIVSKIQEWGDRNHPQWVDYFRIALGITLIWKGVAFAMNLHAFTNLMDNAGLGTAVSISLVAHTIIALHIIGGMLIALGSHTRLFCLLNIPILFTAVFFVNMPEHIMRPYSELWLSATVLIALFCFLVEGDGKLSIEYKKAQQVAEQNNASQI